ncbi:MAG: twin-arginine translocation signal domain-containing protein, partial [Desulfocapsa sp.]|nr:twin-arginine translocation signal domain-containing protein [Desulfocapsa sp.]
MSINRRKFLQASAATTAAVVAAPSIFGPQEADANIGELTYEGEVGEWVASTCQGCTSWCSVQG